ADRNGSTLPGRLRLPRAAAARPPLPRAGPGPRGDRGPARRAAAAEPPGLHRSADRAEPPVAGVRAAPGPARVDVPEPAARLAAAPAAGGADPRPRPPQPGGPAAGGGRARRGGRRPRARRELRPVAERADLRGRARADRQ